MESERLRRLVFGEVAELYDKCRPNWPVPLVSDVLEFAALESTDAGVEVGAGTGKASLLFAEAGVTLRCVEPDPAMAAIAKRRLSSYSRVSVDVSGFEEWSADRKFKLLVSAQAWHWIDPSTRINKACDVLTADGVMALFWHASKWGDQPLRFALDEIYERCAPSLESPGWFPRQINETADVVFEEMQSSPRMHAVELREYPHKQTYSTDEYVDLLLTQSENRLLDERVRDQLFDEISRAVDDVGGKFTLDYVARLVLARRVS